MPDGDRTDDDRDSADRGSAVDPRDGPDPRDPDETRDLRRLRRSLVERDVAPVVRDRRVLAALRRVPRHRFVPTRHRDRAYEDRPFPIGEGQVITQPSLVARMAAAAVVGPEDRVLEVGAGSGYGAAVLAELAAEVWTVERRKRFVGPARRRLEELGYGDVRVRLGDASGGWAEGAPWDAVVCAAGAPAVPEPLLDELRSGRWLVIPLGDQLREQTLYRIRRSADGVRKRESLGPVRFVPMVGEAGWPAEGV